MHELALLLSGLAPIAAIVLWRIEIPALRKRLAAKTMGELQEFLLILDVGFTIGNAAILIAPLGMLYNGSATVAACMTGFTLLAITGFAAWAVRLKWGKDATTGT